MGDCVCWVCELLAVASGCNADAAHTSFTGLMVVVQRLTEWTCFRAAT